MARAGANFYTFTTPTDQFLHIAPPKPRRAHARPWMHVDMHMDRTVPRAAGTVRAAPVSGPHTAQQPTTLVPPCHPAQASCENSENESCDEIPSSAPAVAGPPPTASSSESRSTTSTSRRAASRPASASARVDAPIHSTSGSTGSAGPARTLSRAQPSIGSQEPPARSTSLRWARRAATRARSACLVIALLLPRPPPPLRPRLPPRPPPPRPPP